MTTSMKKRRPPRKQLLEAGKFARELLAERKIILPKEKSAVDTIMQTKGAPMLPGIPAYLPYPWTINGSRRILYDLAREWEHEHKSDGLLNNITEFFKFVVKALREEESVINQKIHITVQTKEYDFRFLHQKDAIKGIRKLLVDSFAVSIIAKSNTDVVAYLEWFQEWTENLLKQWGKQTREVK